MKADRYVDGLFIAEQAQEPLVRHMELKAIEGRGLLGDRYYYQRGTYSHWPGGGRDITLIEAEVVAPLLKRYAINPEQLRRNILTRGVRLNDLVGQRFQLGEVVLYGVRLCEPCRLLDQLAAPGLMHELQNGGGLRADIISGGTIKLGDKLTLVPTGLA